jgi:hypothetical protein
METPPQEQQQHYPSEPHSDENEDDEEEEEEEEEEEDDESLPGGMEGSDSEESPMSTSSPTYTTSVSAHAPVPHAKLDVHPLQAFQMSSQPPTSVYPSYLNGHIFMSADNSSAASLSNGGIKSSGSHASISHMDIKPQLQMSTPPSAASSSSTSSYPVPLSSDVLPEEFLPAPVSSSSLSTSDTLSYAPPAVMTSTAAHLLSSSANPSATMFVVPNDTAKSATKSTPTSISTAKESLRTNGKSGMAVSGKANGDRSLHLTLPTELPTFFTKDEKPIAPKNDDSASVGRKKPPKDNHRMLLLSERNMRVNYIGKKKKS